MTHYTGAWLPIHREQSRMKNAEQSPESAPANLAGAWAFFDEGRLEAAIALARQVIEQSPAGQPHADAALGWFLLSAGSVDEAEATLTSSLGLHPGFAPLHWYLGLVYVRQGRREEACQALATAVTIDPELDEAAVTLAWVLGDLGRFAEATLFSRTALAKKAQPDRMAQLGWLLVCQEQWEEAVSQLSQVLSLEPARLDARSHLATALQRLGRSNEALQVLADGLALSPDVTSLLLQRIHLLLDLHRPKEARDACCRLLTLQPREGTSWYLLALVLVQRKRPGVALRALARARRLAPAQPEVWTQTAWLALEAGDLHAAREAVERVLALAPEDSAHQVLAAVVMEASGNLPAASEHAEEAVARAQGSAAAWRALAQVRSRQDRLGEAEEALRTALNLEPKDTSSTYRSLGWVYVAGDRFDAAAEAFASAVHIDPNDAASWYGLAHAYRASENFSNALMAITGAMRLRPDWPAALAMHGNILIDSGPDFWERAVVQLSKALVLEPEDSETRCQLGSLLHRLERDNEALKLLAEGLVVSPDAANLLQQRIYLLLDMRRTAEARAACHRLLKLQPLEATSWYLQSLVLVQRKRPGIAEYALGRARRLAPQRSDLWRQTGWLALETGNLRNARNAVEYVLALAPEDPRSDVLAAVVLEASGNLQVALEHAEKAIARDGQSGEAWRALARVWAHQDRLSDAENALRTALALDPQNACDSYKQLGWVYFADDRREESITAFAAAVRANESDPPAWYGLAEAYRSVKQYADALEAIRGALRLHKSWSNAIELRRRIINEQINELMRLHLLHFDSTPEHTDSPQVRTVAPMRNDATPSNPVKGANYDYALCSFCTKSHLPLLRTLVASARKHFSGPIFLLLIDSDDRSLVPEGTTPVSLHDVIEPSIWQDMLRRYDILELCCTLKPFLMRFVARTSQCPVFYLDADTYLFGSLSPVLPSVPDFSVFLTPHLLSPIAGERHVEEIGMLRVGAYNAGIVGVGMGKDALRFLDWWADRASEYAYDAPEQGIFTDQKWVDLVPSFFEQVHISREVGLNVGPWRVTTEQDFSETPAGGLAFCGEPVTMMHLSRFNPGKPGLLAAYLPRAQTQDTPLGRFLRRYAQEVIQNRH